MIECLGMKQGHTILEVGCGEGSLVRQLRSRGLKVTGLDLSSAMAKLTSDALVGDAARLPFRDSKFDFVVMYSVAHYFRDLRDSERALNEAERVGSIGIFVGDIPSMKELDWGVLRIQPRFFVARGYRTRDRTTDNKPPAKVRYDAWKMRATNNLN
jgi:ubiquinone/menaquinone biosynthesis C-methylase UbiE